ncbi:MAG: protein kinase [Planctomycetota bacterium]
MNRSQTTTVDSARGELVRDRPLRRSESGRFGFDLPRRIGPYRVLSPLGRGGMAQVVLAQDPAGHRVALKVLDPIASSDEEEDLARLRREGQLLGSVSHPNVVAVEAIGVCSTSGRGYLALEFVEGWTSPTGSRSG